MSGNGLRTTLGLSAGVQRAPNPNPDPNPNPNPNPNPIPNPSPNLRGQMSGRVAELQGSVQKFSARWFELKPKKIDATKRADMEEIIARVKEWHAEFEEVRGYPYPYPYPLPQP